MGDFNKPINESVLRGLAANNFTEMNKIIVTPRLSLLFFTLFMASTTNNKGAPDKEE
jgi:hypothetical protein